MSNGTCFLDKKVIHGVCITDLSRTGHCALVLLNTNMLGVNVMPCDFGAIQGRVVEEGSHAELLALNGRYAELWARQGVDDLYDPHHSDEDEQTADQTPSENLVDDKDKDQAAADARNQQEKLNST